jgi:hypothetical protein
MGLTMSDWTDVLKVVPQFGVAGNEQKINQEIEVFQEKQITPFVSNIMANLKQGQLPVFKLRVDNNAANSGPQGDTFIVGRDQIRRLGGDPNRIKAKLQEVFKRAGYKAKGSFMGKDITVQIPKTAIRTSTGQRMTDPRQLQARDSRSGFMNTLRRQGRKINPFTAGKDRRAREFIQDNPTSNLVQGQF